MSSVQAWPKLDRSPNVLPIMDMRVGGQNEKNVAGGVLRFGACRLNVDRGVLAAGDGTETMLRPKTLDLALFLLQNPRRVVSRAEILDAVWPGVFVTDDSVTQCVTEFRRAIGAEGAALLKTLPRRGYLLESEVVAGPATLPGPVPEPESQGAAEPLPLRTEAARRRAPWIGAGLVAVGALAWMLWPTPPAPPPGPLAGVTQPAVTTPSSMAAATPSSVPAGAHGATEEPPPSAAEQSMALWREGRAVLRSSGRIVETRLQARALFERAIELDPTNFRAMAEAAFTYTNAVLGGVSLTPEADLARAAWLTERAVAIESRHAVTHTARAAVLRLQRRHAEALEHYQMAVALDPGAHASRANGGWMLLLIGRGEEAGAPVLASLAAGPSPQFIGHWLTQIGLIELHIGKGDHGVGRLQASLDHEAFLSRQERLIYLIAALAANGETEAARNLATDTASRFPQAKLAWFATRAQSDHPVYRAQFERILRLLRAAGLPE
jgi:DNA-binding winged helix-turn-helix (wHTH) protein/Tfp pilus assembly protein PilF